MQPPRPPEWCPICNGTDWEEVIDSPHYAWCCSFCEYLVVNQALHRGDPCTARVITITSQPARTRRVPSLR